MSNNISTTAKHKIESLTEDERTPKRIKCAEPDLIVVVNGVEFYHHKIHLATACPFFDDMLSSNMKEAKEGKIIFPYKDPEQWLNVCKLLDQSDIHKKRTLESIIRGYKDIPKDFTSMVNLFSWFDYLGLESMAEECDRLIANQVMVHYRKGRYLEYEVWCKLKTINGSQLQVVANVFIKDTIVHYLIGLQVGSKKPSDCLFLKEVLLDDHCGEELWKWLLKRVKIPPSMIEELSREAIVESPLFFHILGTYKFN